MEKLRNEGLLRVCSKKKKMIMKELLLFLKSLMLCHVNVKPEKGNTTDRLAN